MKLIYTGDFERLKDFGYDYESVLEEILSKIEKR